MDDAGALMRSVADFGVHFFCGPDADFSQAPCFMHSGKTLGECGCPDIMASDEWMDEKRDAYWSGLGRKMAEDVNNRFMAEMFGIQPDTVME